MSREHFEKVLRDAADAGVYHLPMQGMPELLAASESMRFALFRVDLGQVKDKAAFFERLALALQFPEWFGHNWDALQDCLADMSWLPAEGYVVILERCDAFRADGGEDFATMLQVFDAAADAWREENVPFWTLVDMHADGIAYLPGIA